MSPPDESRPCNGFGSLPHRLYNPGVFRHVPNLITGMRLVLAAVFFALLSRYQFDPHPESDRWWLNFAFIIYLIALVSDFLDGYLARKWHVEGAFGRVVDPFVDKVLVLGSFIFFAGKNFIIPSLNPGGTPSNVLTITGVVPWMVVVILARELLVTSLRSVAESQGVAFGAVFIGKAKLVTQSVTILAILLFVNYLPQLANRGWEHHARVGRDVCIWVTLIVTVWSGLTYVTRSVSLYFQGDDTRKPMARSTPEPLTAAARR